MIAIAQQLRMGTMEVEAAADSEKIPHSILHTFAIDCAGRCLQYQGMVNESYTPSFWRESLEAKQKWIEEKLSGEEMEEWAIRVWIGFQQLPMRDIIGENYSDSSRHLAFRSVTFAVHPDPHVAAKSAILSAAKSIATYQAGRDAEESNYDYPTAYGLSLRYEEKIYRDYLAFLIEEYVQQRRFLLSVLLDRKRRIELAIPRWQQESEDALYS